MFVSGIYLYSDLYFQMVWAHRWLVVLSLLALRRYSNGHLSCHSSVAGHVISGKTNSCILFVSSFLCHPFCVLPQKLFTLWCSTLVPWKWSEFHQKDVKDDETTTFKNHKLVKTPAKKQRSLYVWLLQCVGHSAWAAEGREGRSQAGPKPAQRAAT